MCCPRSTSRSTPPTSSVALRRRQGRGLGAVQPDGAEHVPQRHHPDRAGGNADLGRCTNPRTSTSRPSGTLLSQSVVAASVFYKDIDNFIENDAGNSSGSSIRSATTVPTPLTAFQNLVATGCLLRRWLLQLQHPAAAQRRRRRDQGPQPELPAAVRPDRLRHRGQLHVRRRRNERTATTCLSNRKRQYNLSPYYERDPFSARVTYGWRSEYLAGGFVAGAPPVSVDECRRTGP